uniref:Uncharacterized protein n=1 Tax=Trichogramma kaykai TaxID=54128 RepID=A0ABD2WCU8_9HYME
MYPRRSSDRSNQQNQIDSRASNRARSLRSTEEFDPKLRQVIIQQLMDEETAEKAKAKEMAINGSDEKKKEDPSKKSLQN